ncbi:hypothetical protein EBN03_17990 [Nocardia stercoris]|uniref:ATP-grasp domain-containing protein n=2 Tax=Nocardia stercoris TaxID=2483361 RepID=A0A3M2L434_9NOCA|nr:hypothetical protein EBN03_17990 [Nocardia stercoris]
MYVGPAALTSGEFAALTRRLLGLRPERLRDAVERELRFGTGDPGIPGVLLYTSTPAKDTLGAALAEVAAGRPPVDWPTIIEARSVLLAQPGDLHVGRSAPWRAAAGNRLTAVVPDTGHYYFLHSLLVLAARDDPSLDPIVGHIRRNPEGSIRVYAADEPTLAFLLWLRRRAGVATLNVEANHPAVFEAWSHKAVLHPRVDEAAALRVGPDPRHTLAAETALTPLARELGIRVPRLPGYTLPADLSFDGAFRAAATLLRDRFGITRGCLKAAKSSSGQGIRTDIDLAAELPGPPGPACGEWVLEAQAEYCRLPVTGHLFQLAPSVHLRRGTPADGMTLQFLSDTFWQGNVYFDRDSCEAAGVPVPVYDRIRAALIDLHSALHELGLVTGGIDFAVARVGGRFGRSALTGLQDLNLSACGADLLRAFRDRTRESGLRSAATKVVVPPQNMTTADLQRLLDGHTDLPATAIACIPGQWAMIAVAAPGPVAAAEAACRLTLEVSKLSE